MQVKFKQHLWRHFAEIDTDHDEIITLVRLLFANNNRMRQLCNYFCLIKHGRP